MTRQFLAAGVMLATFSTGAMAHDCAVSGDAKVGVVEIVQFRLAEGVDRADFVSAAAATMPALCELDGFVGRTLSEGEDGVWIDYAKWTNLDSAQAAMAGAMENPALLPFITSIDPESIVLTYQTLVDLK